MIIAASTLRSKLNWVVNFGYLSDKSMLQSMLEAHWQTMRKPSPSTKSAELSLLSRILDKANSPLLADEAADYLVGLKNYKLLNVQSLDLIENWVQTNSPSLSPFHQLSASCFLVEQGRHTVFNQHSQRMQQKLKNQGERQRQQLAELIFNYCKSIVARDITIIKFDKIHKRSVLPMLGTLHNQKWANEVELVGKAYDSIGLPSEKIDENFTKNLKLAKRRSNLEVEVEALLKALRNEFSREVNIIGFTVDFLVTINSGKHEIAQGRLDKCILEVMGSHHYTVEDRLFGRDIFRVLTLNKLFPVGIIHADDLNPLKGVQNRMEYIESIISSSLSCSTPNFEANAMPGQR